MSLDLLARVSVLEGIAGVKPGTWMGNAAPEREIVEVFGAGVLPISSLGMGVASDS